MNYQRKTTGHFSSIFPWFFRGFPGSRLQHVTIRLSERAALSPVPFSKLRKGLLDDFCVLQQLLRIRAVCSVGIVWALGLQAFKMMSSSGSWLPRCWPQYSRCALPTDGSCTLQGLDPRSSKVEVHCCFHLD